MEPTASLPMQQGREREHMVRTQEQVKNHHHRRRHDHAAEEARIEPTERGAATAGLKHDLDGLLDEIDAALEDNAERFVRG